MRGQQCRSLTNENPEYISLTEDQSLLPAQLVRHHPAHHGPHHAAHDEGRGDDGEDDVGAALVQEGRVVLVVAAVTELPYRFLWGVDHAGVEAEVEHPQHGAEDGPDQDEGDGLNHPDCPASNFLSESKFSK